MLRTSYRKNGKVKHKTIADLSGCSANEIDAVKLALKHKSDLTSLGDIETTVGKSIGAVWVLNFIAERTGAASALGSGVEAKQAMLQVIARVIDRGSRLSAVRFAMRHAVCEVLGIKKLDEDDLYENLAWLAEHPRANTSKARAKVTAKIVKLKADTWLTAKENDRVISVEKNEERLSEVALLDGCYVIKSDVPKDDADAQTLHDRYCDLEMVERAFRTMKTTHLEMRPVFVTKKTSTRGHAFVVMLALLLQRDLERCWVDMDITVEEGIDELSAIHMLEVKLGQATIQDIPKPTKLGKLLLDKAAVTLPTVLPKNTANVHTKKKLHSERNLNLS